MNLDSATQKNLIEHNEIFNNLSQLYRNNNLPNKILLSGEKGTGKSTLAYHLINFVLSKNEEHPYDYKNYKINSENKSFKLIQNKSNSNFNLIDVAEDKKNIDINQIRELIINLNKSSRGSFLESYSTIHVFPNLVLLIFLIVMSLILSEITSIFSFSDPTISSVN